MTSTMDNPVEMEELIGEDVKKCFQERIKKEREILEHQIWQAIKERLEKKMEKKEKRLESVLREHMMDDIRKKEREMTAALEIDINEKRARVGGEETPFTEWSIPHHQVETLSNVPIGTMDTDLGKEKIAMIEGKVNMEIAELERNIKEKNNHERSEQQSEVDKEIASLKKSHFQSLCRTKELLKLQTEFRLKELDRLLRSGGEEKVREQVDLDIAVLENQLREKIENEAKQNMENASTRKEKVSRSMKPFSKNNSKLSRLQRFVSYFSCFSRQSVSVVDPAVKSN